MDLEMPQVNGIDLARMIRQDRRHLSVPIVFLSAEGDTQTQIRARRFGGDDFISKRIDRTLLVQLVELRVERARVLRSLIERDGLTGLVDHARFVERAGQELARSRRTGAGCTLVLIDIDHFKSVNDTWGHQAGDFALKRLSSALSAWLRRTDVVGRYGGEEFAALMLDTTAEQAAPVIDGFRRHFAELDLVASAGTFRMTFSAGLADGRGVADTAAFIAAADEALYRAKREGRNRIVVADPPPADASVGGDPEKGVE
jgi:diguanylate cyclase (GGDEF)-like protein